MTARTTGLTPPAPTGFREWNLLRAAATAAPARFRAVQNAFAVMRARRHLNELPDYLLQDIGISRSQIDHATANGGRREGTRIR